MDITFNCNECGQSITIDAAGKGLQVTCPKCGAIVSVPNAGASVSTAATPPRVPPVLTDHATAHSTLTPPAIITTGNDVAGYVITDYLGIVRGIVVRTVGLGRAFSGAITALTKPIKGGNIPELVEVCEDARRQAYDLMVSQASHLGADAIIAVRYDATQFSSDGLTEILVYGTAVKIKRV